MAEYRTCGKCPLYNYSLSRCSQAWVNPRTKKDTKAAMQFGGSSYICKYSKWKTKAHQELVEELA